MRLEHRHVGRQRRIGRQQQRVAVARRVGDIFRPHAAASARPILDHDLLVPGFGQIGRQRAREQIDRAARRIGNDDVDRAVRIFGLWPPSMRRLSPPALRRLSATISPHVFPPIRFLVERALAPCFMRAVAPSLRSCFGEPLARLSEQIFDCLLDRSFSAGTFRRRCRLSLDNPREFRAASENRTCSARRA